MIKFFKNHLSHIEEQVAYRTALVEHYSPECLSEGQCKFCKCKTPELFYANKACSNTPPCYNELLSSTEWTQLKNQMPND